jgi:hypothetical protein
VESNKNTIRNLIIMIVYVFLPSDWLFKQLAVVII